MPVEDATLRHNPLLVDDVPRWPSERYRAEYAADCAWTEAGGDPARTRRVVDLPDRW